MNYLLDTNVVSELIKKQPNQKVASWLRSINARYFSISVLTLGAVRKGVERVTDMSKSKRMLQWLEVYLPKQFDGRILLIDQEVADKWGYINAGRSLPAIDSLIAATALVHNMKLVTRNSEDFQRIAGLELINPWLT